jgi:hypothetical protein
VKTHEHVVKLPVALLYPIFIPSDLYRRRLRDDYFNRIPNAVDCALQFDLPVCFLSYKSRAY